MAAKRKDDPVLRKWKSETTYFHQIKPALLRNPKYRNKYIAIKDHKIIDVDDDEFKLAHRVLREYPSQFVLIVKVERQERVVEISSPEFFGDQGEESPMR